MARQMLNEQYINQRAEDHNRWLAEADVAWRTRGVKLPYPPFAPYPTEEQVLTKAQELLKFVVDPREPSAPAEPEAVEQVATPDLAGARPLPTEALPTAPHAPAVNTMSPTVDSGPLLKEIERLKQVSEEQQRFLYPDLHNLGRS